MAVTGVVNLTELILNQSLAQSPEAPAGAQAVPGGSTGAVPPAGDSFTLSAQTVSTQSTAEDAGLFQVSQFALTSATAEVLTAQATSPTTSQNPVPAPAPVALSAAVAAGTSQTTVAQNSAATPPPAPAVAAPPQATTNAVGPIPVNSQDQVQSLNTVLLGLGLSNGDIQDIDRIATVTNAYNPALYGDLIQQFEAQTAQQASVPSAANQPVPQH